LEVRSVVWEQGILTEGKAFIATDLHIELLVKTEVRVDRKASVDNQKVVVCAEF